MVVAFQPDVDQERGVSILLAYITYLFASITLIYSGSGSKLSIIVLFENDLIINTFFAETHFSLSPTNDLVNISFVSYSRNSEKKVGRKKVKATTWTEKNSITHYRGVDSFLNSGGWQ